MFADTKGALFYTKIPKKICSWMECDLIKTPASKIRVETNISEDIESLSKSAIFTSCISDTKKIKQMIIIK